MTAVFWWLYFSYVAAIAQRRLELADRTDDDGTRRLHVPPRRSRRRLSSCPPSGDEIVIAHPTETLHTAAHVAVVAGPVIYLVGHVLFRQVMAGSMSGKRVAGVVACVCGGLPRPRHSRAGRRGAAPASCWWRSSSPSMRPGGGGRSVGRPRRCRSSRRRRLLRNPALSERGDLQLVRGGTECLPARKSTAAASGADRQLCSGKPPCRRLAECRRR